jgi:hypothetical protein
MFIHGAYRFLIGQRKGSSLVINSDFSHYVEICLNELHLLSIPYSSSRYAAVPWYSFYGFSVMKQKQHRVESPMIAQ